MTTPSPRNPIRIARGLYADLLASETDLKEGEICFATDQDTLYVKENGVLDRKSTRLNSSHRT